jgi:hypothetical protein
VSTPAPALTVIRVLGAVAAIVAAAWLAVTVASSFARTSVEESFTATGVRSVEVVVDAGTVSVEPADGRDVEVSVTARSTWRAPTTDQEQDGDTLRLSSRCGQSFGLGRCEVRYVVAVPEGVSVDLRVSAGRLAVDGIDGDVRARIDAGEVVLTDLRSARVDATSEVGRVVASFAEAPDDVRATSSTGAVEITLPRDGEPYAVEASSEVGGTTVDVATDPGSPRTVVARTAVGSVVVGSR